MKEYWSERFAGCFLFLAIMMVCLMGSSCTVMAETSGDYEYSVSSYDGTATITRYNGSEKSPVIPKKLNGYAVVRIGEAAFKGNPSIESITIPEYIDYVGKEAFMSCSALKTVKWDSKEDTIHDRTFDSCTSLESVELNDKVAWIDDRAFFLCGKLKSVKIGTEESRLRTVRDLAFSECPNLTSITYAGRKSWWKELLSRIDEETTRKRLESVKVTYALKYAKPGKPSNVKVTYPDMENVHITWKAVPNARNYVVEITGPKGYAGEHESVWAFDADGNPLKKPSLDIVLRYGENWGEPRYPYGKYTFKVYAAGYHTDLDPVMGKASKAYTFKRIEYSTVTWKKYKKTGRKFTMVWKKDKLADGYMLSYILYKYGSEKASKEQKIAILPNANKFTLTIVKPYDSIMFAMRPYLKSGNKKQYQKENLNWINIGPDGKERLW